MPSFSHRFTILAAVTASAVVGSLAAPLTGAFAVDPITTDPAPTLVSPADDPTGSTLLKDVVLTWTADAHATKYQVQMSPNGDWTNNTVTLPSSGETVTTTYDVPMSLPHGAYFWRVRGEDAGGHTAWSAARTLARGWEAPFSIVTAPVNPGDDPTLSWTPVQQASFYRVEFSTKPSFPNTADTLGCDTAATTFTPYKTNAMPENAPQSCFSVSDLADNTKYYWRVEPFDDTVAPAITTDSAPDSGWPCANAVPECDAFTLSGSFTFLAPQAGTLNPNATPTNLTTSWSNASGSHDCTDGAATCAMTPTFSWNPVAGANNYRVTIWRDVDLTNVYRVYETAWPEITPRDGLFDTQAGGGYHWSVQAGTCETSGAQPFCAKPQAGSTPPSNAPCTTASSTATPPAITGLTVNAGPPTMPAGSQGTIALTGSNIQSGACVKTDGGGTITNVSVPSAGELDFSYVAPTSATQLTFVIVNPDGGTSGASPTLTVTGQFDNLVFNDPAVPITYTKTSGTVPLTSPANGSTVNSGPLTYHWGSFFANGGQSAYDARNYHLQVATDPDFDNLVIDDNTIDLTQFTDPALSLPDGTYYWHVQGVDESNNGLTWSSTFHFTRDGTPPLFTLTDKSGFVVNAHLHVSASESDILGTVSQSTLNVFPVVGANTAVPGSWAQTSPTSWTFTPSGHFVVGQTYALRVVGGLHDVAGNLAVASSRSARATTVADDKSPAWSFGSGWSRHTASGSLGGTYVKLLSGTAAAVAIVGSKAYVYGCRAPGFAKLVIQVDGHSLVTVNEHQSFTQCGVLLWSGALTATATHTLRLVASGGAASVDEARVS